MFPEDIKKFVIESNREKVMLSEAHLAHNQDIKTMVGSKNVDQNYGVASNGRFNS